jgi:hypothetical protein
MEFNFHSLTATLELAAYIETFQHHRIFRTKLLNQECLKNRLILSFKDLFILSVTNITFVFCLFFYTQSLRD